MRGSTALCVLLLCSRLAAAGQRSGESVAPPAVMPPAVMPPAAVPPLSVTLAPPMTASPALPERGGPASSAAGSPAGAASSVSVLPPSALPASAAAAATRNPAAARPGVAGELDRLEGRSQEIQGLLRHGGADAGPAKGLGDQAFDNTFRPKAEVLSLLRFNPARQDGVLLSDKNKAGSLVWRVYPRGLAPRIVKIADAATVDNEIAMRAILERFPIFSEQLRAPAALAYRRLWRAPVMVMEDVPNSNPLMGSDTLPLRQKAVLALLALTFGVHDLNPGAFLDVGWEGSTLADFERARFAMAPGSVDRIGGLSELPYVSRYYLNELSDYQPALARWRETFASAAAQEDMAAALRRAGQPPRRVQSDLALFAGNLGRLEAVLAADIAYANRVFLQQSARAGLTDRQARALSAINRAAHRSRADGAARDVMRWLQDAPGGPPPVFVARPEEVRALFRRGLSPDDRRVLAGAARRSEVLGLEGRPLSVEAALRGLDALAAWLQ